MYPLFSYMSADRLSGMFSRMRDEYKLDSDASSAERKARTQWQVSWIIGTICLAVAWNIGADVANPTTLTRHAPNNDLEKITRITDDYSTMAECAVNAQNRGLAGKNVRVCTTSKGTFIVTQASDGKTILTPQFRLGKGLVDLSRLLWFRVIRSD